MKTLIAFLLMSTVAFAGDYHKGATLNCSQCHVMHYSETHGYNGWNYGLGSQGPYNHLLRNDVNNLCLACHDGGGIAPDVLGVNTGNSPADVRLGGYLNRLGIEGIEDTGHTLDTLATAPGSAQSWKPEDENGMGQGLHCTNCHDPHGYAGPNENAYRNLRIDPGYANNVVITYSTFINDPTTDAFQRNQNEYDESNMDWNEPNSSDNKLSRWCAGCHDDFHNTNANNFFVRHPVYDVNIGALGGPGSSLATYNSKVNKVKVMSEMGVWNPAGADVTPTCVSCHKAHGNGNPFGLIFRSGTGTLTEDGDTNGNSVEHLCRQCHIQ